MNSLENWQNEFCFTRTIFVLCLGTENSQIVTNQENVEGDQPCSSEPHSCTGAIATIDLCAGALLGEAGLPGHSWNGCSTTFQSPELFVQCGFIWKETMHFISGTVEFKVSLLWHTSSSVSLWTFQPTLVKYLQVWALIGCDKTHSRLRGTL